MTQIGLFLMQVDADPWNQLPRGNPSFRGSSSLLPLLGFAINGALALSAARKSADAVRAGGEFDFFENGLPRTHSLPTWVGPGVVLLAFLLTLVNFVGMLGADLHEPCDP